MLAKTTFVHHVFFWLNNSESTKDKQDLLQGLEKLSFIKTIRYSHIGQPANTSRGVIDSSYDVSWLIFFDNPEDQDSYQTDPVHLEFVEQCKHLWKKVTVYDAINA